MDIMKFIEEAGGPAKAAVLLKETPRTVASWYNGERLPKPMVVCKLMKLTKGQLDYNRVYAPIIAKMAEKEAKALIKKAAE
ncbi:hypothetical protein [Aeromonas phage 3]|nr:hypothetical protein [Aeromonas phage 3]